MTKRLQHTDAFVIHFRDAAEAGADRFPGRIEHVAPGRTATFESLEELPQLLFEMLRSSASANNNEAG